MKQFFLLLFSLSIILSAAAQTPIYLDPKAPMDKRVDDLVSKMTLDEKVSQMLYRASAIPRLNIPEYNWWNEGLHGVARNGLATSFPQAIGLAATWDRQLMNEVATAIGDEGRAKYNIAIAKGQHGRYQGLTFWSPNINIFRDPRWGRGMETYGEDPYLTGQMAVQFIRGLQGTDLKYYKVIATSKHFAVHSGPEPDRHTFDASVSEYDLRETYLPAFKMSVVDGKVASLMCAYTSLRGKACCSNDPLLTNILRKEWGFKGYVVSDCGAIDDIFKGHKQATDATDASALAVKAGDDLECGGSYIHLVDAVKKGLITEASIDTSVRRLFTARMKLGMFDPPALVPYSLLGEADVDSRKHRELALLAAHESIVLLKNDKNTLPLKKDVGTIAIIGPNANDVELLLANYNGFAYHTVTPIEGIIKTVSPKTKVLYEPGCEVASGVPLLEVIPVKYFSSPGEGMTMKQGLKAEYFDNDQFKGNPVTTRIDTVIDVMNWNAKESFSVRWTGVLHVPTTGKYNLGCWGGDDFKLYLDDSLLFADDNDPDNDMSLKELTLSSNRSYRIRVEVAVNTPASPFHLIWSMPDEERENRAIEAAKKADVVVLCMGLSPRLEGEEMDVKVDGFSGGDRTSLDLPATQENLIKKIAALGKPIVLVMLNGSAVSINWENDNIPAIIETWYGGQAAGTAIADVLFGDYNPSGRLPVTFYKSVSQLPDFKDYNMKGRTYRYFSGDVLYPFGYGLSYTSFTIGNPKVSGSVKGDKPAKVSVEVKNTGSREGEEVVELYVKGAGANGNDAIKTLRGFEKVFLKPNETKTVEFTVSPATLTFYKEGSGETLDKGEHTLLVGSSSSDKDLKEVKVRVE